MLAVPAPVALNLAVFKLFTSLKLVPLYNSVKATVPIGGLTPPKHKAAVFVPAPPKALLA